LHARYVLHSFCSFIILLQVYHPFKLHCPTSKNGGRKISVECQQDKEKDATDILLCKMNILAMSALHSACRHPVSCNAINNSISEDVPQGDAHQAWLNLHTIFKPTSSAQKQELEFQFTQCSLIFLIPRILMVC
jgi:hypothetical protein